MTSCSQPPKRPDALCGICLKGPDSNKKGLPEELIHCSQCENSGMSVHDCVLTALIDRPVVCRCFKKSFPIAFPVKL